MNYLEENYNKIHTNLTKLSLQFSKKGVDAEDLYQNAILAILENQNSFDPNHSSNASFVTYATGIAINAMNATLLQNQSGLSMSDGTRHIINKLHNANETDLDILAKKLKITKSRAEKLYKSSEKILDHTMMDNETNNNQESFYDLIDLDKLTEQERLIFQEYMKNKNLSEISRDNNIKYSDVVDLFDSMVRKFQSQNGIDND